MVECCAVGKKKKTDIGADAKIYFEHVVLYELASIKILSRL